MSRVRIKAGCTFDVIAPAGYRLLAALKAIAQTFPQDLTLTSGTDGKHAKTSKHYTGNAYDVRSKDMTPALKKKFLDLLGVELGPERFFYFLEAPGTANEHFHLQLRTGKTFTVKDLL